MAKKKRYWLFKSEPESFSIDDLAKAKAQRTLWDGVRNYTARNLLRDEIQRGDEVIYYHSACKEPAAVGVAKVVRAGYPDPTQFDAKSKYHDAQSNPDDPRWYCVDIEFVEKFARPVTLKEIKGDDTFDGMPLVQRGQRLSVQPVEADHAKAIRKRGKRRGDGLDGD